jgi:hypothetical protein
VAHIFFLSKHTHLYYCGAVQVVHEEFGIVEGLMTTVHATTGWFLVILQCVLSVKSFVEA